MSAFGSQCFHPLRASSESYPSLKSLSCRRRNVVVASVSRDSAADVSLESKIAVHDWEIKYGGKELLMAFHSTVCFSPEGVHHYPVDALMDQVKWDDKGLAVAIAQNVDTGAVLMQGFANKAALATTISSRKATFYSRSRSTLWTKGETSMNFINVHDIFLDCDKDSIIYLGKPDGPTCHTGSDTCYYTSVSDLLEQQQDEENNLALTTLYKLESTIAERKAESISNQYGKPSWTKRLLLDEKLLCSKIREEANELCHSLEDDEDKSRAASEMADVLYHSMVLLALKNVKFEEVLEILRKRFSKSGIEEKQSRPAAP